MCRKEGNECYSIIINYNPLFSVGWWDRFRKKFRCKFQVLKCISQLELAQMIGTGVKASNNPVVSGSSVQCNSISFQLLITECI